MKHYLHLHPQNIQNKRLLCRAYFMNSLWRVFLGHPREAKPITSTQLKRAWLSYPKLLNQKISRYKSSNWGTPCGVGCALKQIHQKCETCWQRIERLSHHKEIKSPADSYRVHSHYTKFQVPKPATAQSGL